MNGFIITTDSGCDLPMSICVERAIIPLQLKYVIEDKIFTDSMHHENCREFYDKMRRGAVPKTSQVNVFEFVDFWKTLLPKGLPIVHISLGSGISGTYANGLLARDILIKEHPDAKIFVVDSTLASVGYGMLALKAADMRDQGISPKDCVEWLEAHKVEINTYYTTSDLTYLCRSGRVSRVGAMVGTMFKINPILNLDKEGHLIVQEKIRGEKATIKRIYAIIKDLAVNPENQTLYICHSDIIDKAKSFGDKLCQYLGFRDVYYTYIGPTIGSHSGPGLMAAFFFGKPRTM
ncbi:MAG: DegV family protein [Christensenellales bacterium]|jgi:DegV family protein with EDD domain